MAVFSSCGQSPVWPCISAYAHSRVTGLGHDLSAFVYETQTAQACKITYFMQLVVCCTAFLYRVSVNNIYYGTYIPYTCLHGAKWLCCLFSINCRINVQNEKNLVYFDDMLLNLHFDRERLANSTIWETGNCKCSTVDKFLLDENGLNAGRINAACERFW